MRTIRSKKKGVYKKVYKKDVRRADPGSKEFVADMVLRHPELLDLYKSIAAAQGPSSSFDDSVPSLSTVCKTLSSKFSRIKPGRTDAEIYHKVVLGAATALFFPRLIQPRKEWEINSGRKRIDVVFTNAADSGFFSQRRDDHIIHANTVIVKCKNYADDIANDEIDQLYARFDNNRGRFGILACRKLDDPDLALQRCRDLSKGSQGYIIILTDEDFVRMLELKAKLDDNGIEAVLYGKFRQLLE